HRGWHIPRRLPHFDGAETCQSITFRLADSLPHAVAVARKDEDDLAYRRRIELALDAGRGECLLDDPVCAEIVEGAFLHGAPPLAVQTPRVRGNAQPRQFFDPTSRGASFVGHRA